MAATLLKQAMQLTPAERIILAEQLWDSLVDSDSDFKLSPAQLRELDRPLKRVAKTGPTGDDWRTVKSRLRKR